MSNISYAAVFPGQGSQKVGMLAEVASQWSVVNETFAQASEVLQYDLWQLIQDGPQESLNLTEKAQPALLASSVAVWRVLQETCGFKPSLLAGHSLGEWSALVCAGVVGFEDAIKLVQLRGRYMQEAVPVGVGTMAAIVGLSDEDVKKCCDELAGEQVVSAVNFNSPGQVVIAGHTAAVEKAAGLCSEAGAKRAMMLPVSAPFHTSLMKPAADRLAEHIAEITFKTPSIPVIHNVNAASENEPEKIKALIIEQIYAPVLWVDCVSALSKKGATDILECGPGRVLSGLVKRTDKTLNLHNTDSVSAIESI